MAHNTYFQDEELEQVSGHTLLRLLGLLSPYKARVALSLALVAVASVATLLGPYLVKIAIDKYIPEKDLWGIIRLSVLYIVVLILGPLFVRFRILIMVPLGNQAIADLREKLFRHVQRLSFKFFDTRPAGKIIVRLMNNTDQLQELIKHGFIMIITELFRLVVIFAFMFSISLRLSLIALAVTPLLAVCGFLIKTRIRRRWQLYQKKNSNLNAYIHESLIGIKETQAFVREGRNSQIMGEQLDDAKRTWMSSVTMSHLLFPIVLVINTLSVVLVYWLGYRFLGFGMITLGTLIAFSQYIWMITEPVVNLSNFYNTALVAMTAAERIFEILDTEAKIVNGPRAYPIPEIQGDVEFQNVSFEYEEGKPIFQELSFRVNSGETVALVGETGAGKSTIINLMTRFYDIQGGSILIDGHDIGDITLESLRGQVGVMMQDPFVFSGTLAENIRYGKLDATKEEIEAAAKAVHAHEFISQMEQGYETELNEGGTRLSVGQKQLVAFARTLLYDPKILILDEATASIDTQTELLLQKAVAYILANRTSFVIAHRLSTIRQADRIVVIERGKIIEQGDHEQLLHRGGKYFDLYKAQYHKVLS